MKQFAVIGNPVRHSLSPLLHNAVFESLSLPCRYSLLELCPQELPCALEALKKGEYQGFSVTIPYKKEVVSSVDVLSDQARLLQSVNTLVHKDNCIYGYNTDYLGFKKCLASFSFVDGSQALVLGYGGASRAVIAALEAFGLEVTVSTRSPELAQKNTSVKLFADIKDLNPFANWSLIVNTTPLGMSSYSNQNPLPSLHWFRKECIYIDIIYTPLITPFIASAREVGATTTTGDKMFLWQAVSQAELFTGYKPLPSFVVDIMSGCLSEVLSE